MLLDEPIHIHTFNFDVLLKDVTPFEQVLSMEEKLRADSFVYEKDRKKFIISRGQLRITIGEYLKQDPALIEFKYSPNGKPYIAGSELYFNISHSHNKVIFAFSYKKTLGVDIEYIRDLPNLEQLAKENFLREEYEKINSLDKALRKQLFFRYWTCKEAYLKATGEGVFGLEDIDFEIPLKGETFSFIDRHNKRWSCQIIKLDDNYIGAVVAEAFFGDSG
jgi:4'-phosphopantetheinyl transferase